MIKRVMFTTVLAAQFLAISAVGNTVIVRSAVSADMRADDPSPCPECDACTPAVAIAVADDPSPCPECDACTPALAKADDPSPCPECDACTPA